MTQKFWLLKVFSWIALGMLFLSQQGCARPNYSEELTEAPDMRVEKNERKIVARKTQAKIEARKAEALSNDTSTGDPTPSQNPIGSDLIVTGKLPTPGLDKNLCYNSVQNKVAWDYKGSKKWSPTNIERLCVGAENTSQPAQCFKKVMHGGVRWRRSKGGTKWKWKNAIKLCKGTNDFRATVVCFQRTIRKEKSWPKAIRACESQ